MPDLELLHVASRVMGQGLWSGDDCWKETDTYSILKHRKTEHVSFLMSGWARKQGYLRRFHVVSPLPVLNWIWESEFAARSLNPPNLNLRMILRSWHPCHYISQIKHNWTVRNALAMTASISFFLYITCIRLNTALIIFSPYHATRISH